MDMTVLVPLLQSMFCILAMLRNFDVMAVVYLDFSVVHLCNVKEFRCDGFRSFGLFCFVGFDLNLTKKISEKGCMDVFTMKISEKGCMDVFTMEKGNHTTVILIFVRTMIAMFLVFSLY